MDLRSPPTLPSTPVAHLTRLAAAALALSLCGCVVAPLPPPHPYPHRPPPPMAMEPAYAPPPGVVYVAPNYPMPAPGYAWRYNPRYGWGWFHGQYGWHQGWR